MYTLTHHCPLSHVGEESTKHKGEGNVGKIDEEQRGEELQTEGITEVTAIERVATKQVIHTTSEWSVCGGRINLKRSTIQRYIHCT